VVLPQFYSAFLRFFLLFQFPSPLFLRSRRHAPECCRYCSVSGGRGGCPLSDGVDALCRPHPVARGGPEATASRRAWEARKTRYQACLLVSYWR
jgi:hypothetical protein